MGRERIHTQSAPDAIGPYSQAIAIGDLVFCSGQIPLDPKSMELVDGDIGEQTRQVMHNLQAVLQSAGLNFNDVVKTTIFLLTMDDFGAVNEVYGEFFADPPPARSTVAVAGLPKGARVEIDVIARR